jgi:Tfp pilus assembly protein PilN
MRAVNLIPTEQRSGGAVGARSEGAAFAVLALLAGLAVLTLMYGMAHHTAANRRAEAAALTARAQQFQAQATQLASYTSFVALREQRLEAISQLVGSRFDWAAVMGELSRVLPSDVSLNSIQGAVGSTTGSLTGSGSKAPSATTSSATAATPVSSATPPGTVPDFTLTGCATSQAAVAQTLVRLRLVSGVSAVTLQSSTKSSSGGGDGGGSCPANDPLFSADVSFNPLPSAPTSSVQALESTVSSGGTDTSGQHSVATVSKGVAR